jgi:hypothetical protein
VHSSGVRRQPLRLDMSLIMVRGLWARKQQLRLKSDTGEHPMEKNDLLVSASVRNFFTPTNFGVDDSAFLDFAFPLPLALLPLPFLDFGLGFDFLGPVGGSASASSWSSSSPELHSLFMKVSESATSPSKLAQKAILHWGVHTYKAFSYNQRRTFVVPALYFWYVPDTS